MPDARRVGAVAALIRDAHDRHGVTYREIERLTGISKASVSDYARGVIRGLPQADRIEALAKALRVPRSTLLHAFLVDLGLDLLGGPPSGDPEQSVRDADWLTQEEQDIILRQLEMFRRRHRRQPE